MMDKKEEESSSTDYDSDNVRNMVITNTKVVKIYGPSRDFLVTEKRTFYKKMTMLEVKVISILKLSLFRLEWVLKRSILKFIWSIKIRFQMHPMKSIYPDFMMFVEKFWLNRFPLVILAVSGPTYES